MNRSRRSIVLGAFASVGIVVLVGFVFSKRAGQLAQAAHERELSIEEISPMFVQLIGHPLPATTENLRAIYEGGADPGMFLRFETDANGIAYIVGTFSGRTTTITVLDANDLKAMAQSGTEAFHQLSYWEETLGVSLFDQESIDSARVLESGPFSGVSYKILIDERRNTIYMHASHLPSNCL